eukprot:64417_1
MSRRQMRHGAFCVLLLFTLIWLFNTSTIISTITKSSTKTNVVYLQAQHIQTHPDTNSSSVQVELPYLIDNTVIILDIIWIPHQHRVMVISFQNKHFKQSSYDLKHNISHESLQLDSKYNVSYESIQHPCSLNISVNGNPCTQCNKIKTKSGDSNVDGTLDIGSFHLETSDSILNIKINQQLIIQTLNKEEGKLNVLFNFNRTKDITSNGISVCVKLIKHYSRFVLDIINYYKVQNVSHVY